MLWFAAWEVVRRICCEIVCQNWFFIVFPLASFSVVAFANTIWIRSICWLLLWTVLFWLSRTAMGSSSMEPLLGLVSVGTREKVHMMFAVYRPSSSYYYNSCRLHRLSHHSSICMWGWYKVHELALQAAKWFRSWLRRRCGWSLQGGRAWFWT